MGFSIDSSLLKKRKLVSKEKMQSCILVLKINSNRKFALVTLSKLGRKKKEANIMEIFLNVLILLYFYNQKVIYKNKK